MGATTSRRRGHIEQRPGGSYRVSVYAGIDPITHRRRYLRETAPTKREAEKACTRLQSQVDEKRHPKSNATLGELIDQWLEVSSHESSTSDRYSDLVRLYLRPAFGSTPAGKIDAELLEMFYARLRRCRELCTGRAQPGHACRPLAGNTIRKIHFIIRGALDLGVRWRHLGVNEAEIARPPAFERHDPDPPSAEEAAALLNDAAEDSEWCLFLWLTMVTGSRRGEMCAIRWTDLDLNRKVVSVSRAISGTTEKSTKSHQGRRLALDEQAVAMLRAHLERRREVCKALGVELPADGFVFSLSPDGSKSMRPATATQRFRRLAERLKLRQHPTALAAALLGDRASCGRCRHPHRRGSPWPRRRRSHDLEGLRRVGRRGRPASRRNHEHNRPPASSRRPAAARTLRGAGQRPPCPDSIRRAPPGRPSSRDRRSREKSLCLSRYGTAGCSAPAGRGARAHYLWPQDNRLLNYRDGFIVRLLRRQQYPLDTLSDDRRRRVVAGQSCREVTGVDRGRPPAPSVIRGP